MGIFIEDLLNFGNLIDAEIEIRLSPADLKRAYASLDFDIKDGVLRVISRKKVLFFNKSYELRLSEVGDRVRKDRENMRQWAFFRVLSREGLEEVLKLPGFTMEEEYLGIDLMPAVSLTEIYEKIPKQFREKLVINRYKLGKEYLSAFFKFEK